MSGQLFGPHPAVVDSYDKNTRTCRIQIPGVTDGGRSLPEAEVMYPLGDKPKPVGNAGKNGGKATEIEIMKGDAVWIEFIRGDPRYPLITGHRCTNVGNTFDTRRFNHKKIELVAETKLRLVVGDDTFIEANSNQVEITTPKLIINGEIEINGAVTIKGEVVQKDGQIWSNGIFMDQHVHKGVRPGSGLSGIPHKEEAI